ncbi:MAG: hypothetical protein ACX939_02280 [Hyphococcus sp.]
MEDARQPQTFGVAAMAVAALALLVAVVHMSAGPFAPQQPVEQTIVDTALKIKEAAQRAAAGEPAPPPQRAAMDIDQIITLGYLALAGVAMGIALIGLFKDSKHTPAYFGFTLGGAVILITWLQWIAILVCGAVILAAIIYSFGDILSF